MSMIKKFQQHFYDCFDTRRNNVNFSMYFIFMLKLPGLIWTSRIYYLIILATSDALWTYKDHPQTVHASQWGYFTRHPSKLTSNLIYMLSLLQKINPNKYLYSIYYLSVYSQYSCMPNLLIPHQLVFLLSFIIVVLWHMSKHFFIWIFEVKTQLRFKIHIYGASPSFLFSTKGYKMQGITVTMDDYEQKLNRQ